MLPRQGGREGTCVLVFYGLLAFAVVAMLLGKVVGKGQVFLYVLGCLRRQFVDVWLVCACEHCKRFGFMRFVCNRALESRCCMHCGKSALCGMHGCRSTLCGTHGFIHCGMHCCKTMLWHA
jgi:hypothetical protein